MTSDPNTISVDVTNPGQFYACCGLLELATTLHPDGEVTGHFEGDQFHLSLPPAGVIDALRGGTVEVEPLPEGSARIRGGEAHKNWPMRVCGVLVLDWWLDETSGDFKTWAGGMSAPLTTVALHESLRAAELGERPFDATARSSAAAFCFDCRMGGDAVDLGGADTDLPRLKYPAVDLLAFVGLQRFRPGDVSRRVKRYATWAAPLPAATAAAVACGAVPPLAERAYRFPLRPRDASFRYKSFGRGRTRRFSGEPTMSDNVSADRFNQWLREDGPAAVVIRQPLRPVEGERGVLFPPTYAGSKDGKAPGGYNIDRTGNPLPGGQFPPVPNVCLVDSVGSQANRTEPALGRLADGKLVPKVTIAFEDGEAVDLLEAGHRVADASVRFSDLTGEVDKALRAARAGDATPLAKLAPTSLVFGVWDSRATQIKLPRIVAGVIRAYDVRELRRSAQYNPPRDYTADGTVDDPGEDKAKKDRYSEEGLLDQPATFTHGGVIAEGGVFREATLNLAIIRDLRAGDDADATRKLQRYVLGLALVAVTYLDGKTLTLRQGCQLVGHGQASRKLVNADGSEDAFEMNNADAVEYAKTAAADFGVGQDRAAKFDKEAANRALGMSSKEAKKGRSTKGGRGKKAAPPAAAAEEETA